MPGVSERGRTEVRRRRRAARRHTMAALASAVVAAGAATGVMTAADDGGRTTARPDTSASPVLEPLPAVPVPSVSPSASVTPSPAPEPSRTVRRSPAPATSTAQRAAPHPGLYRHPRSQVLEWVDSHRDDPRRPMIESRIAEQPAAVWFPAYNPGAVTGQVRGVTAAAAAAGRTPVLVPYAIPDRDCGGASEGGAPGLDAYDAWMEEFAAGLGGGPVIVVLEPDAVALSDCLTAGQRADRFASLARAGRTLHAANPRARVYFDGGHSGWHGAAKQAAALRAAGAATAGDGIFTNVSNFHSTADEAAYARRVLAALGGPPGLGAVIDTSRNGNGAPAAGDWCDPSGRALGRAPTTDTGLAGIDAYLWVKLPGESDGCKGSAGSFTPEYAYELATG
ncbi:glycoside hydrolase family 6 protein [Streptomyces sp. NBC_01185]|uniref:glycoside hydrolase family 6 protein n=1 Tax=Streptomyces sp. NBC_01185 TaxID=2903764 RepID=UPI0038695DD0|nr:glycoside hydrolase family 6 protein [Streptomyces sp. NBC_01185]